MKKFLIPALAFSLCISASALSAEEEDHPAPHTAVEGESSVSADLSIDSLARRPEPAEAMDGTCQANFECGDGNTISCSGISSCLVREVPKPSFVDCDGSRTFCPNMCTVEEVCNCDGESGGGIIRCSSNVGDCQQGNDEVTCDGNTFECRCLRPQF